MTELELQKAKAKSLAAHFKKEAGFHEKKASHHEKCMKAHEGAADHHEKCMGKEMEMATGGNDHWKEHHKAKMNFHKTMAKHHESAMKIHKAHAEHHHAMAEAHSGAEPEKAFKALGVDLEQTTAPVADPAPVVTDPATAAPVADPAAKTITIGDPNMSKTPTELAAQLTATAATVTGPSILGNTNDPDNPFKKQLNDGLNEALKNGLKEILASPEFRKMVQEQLGNTLITELSKQTLAPTAVKTFAVPRTDPNKPGNIPGVAPQVNPTAVAGVDPEFQALVSMDN